MRQFSAPELAEFLKENSPLLLDVREPWEFQTCHIEGSQLVPMRQIPQVAAELPKDQDIVVICHHGIRSKAVCDYLQQFGFDRLINLQGGVDAWAMYVDRNMATY